jgi:HK97 family phage major capsid protein
MNKRILERMLDIRSNNLNTTTLIDDTQSNEFLTTLIDGIRKYSKLLQKSQLIPGKNNSRYIFKIEDDSNVIELLGDESPVTRTDIVSSWECNPKPLGLEIKVPKLVSLFYDNNVEDLLKNILYKPFTKSIEKNVISGSYFDKPLFSTTNIITGTKDFDGLLLLIRELKDNYDDGCIVGNSSVISEIIDTIDKESYLTEYLLNGTIEGVQIISTKDCPESVNDTFLVGFDPNKICLLLVPQLEVKKISTVGSVDNFFHIYGFVNGGDVFNSSIGIKE